MSWSKQKTVLPVGLKKKRKRERKEDWRGAIAYVARKWMVFNFLTKSPDNFYSGVVWNFELESSLVLLRKMFEILVLILSQKLLSVSAELK